MRLNHFLTFPSAFRRKLRPSPRAPLYRWIRRLLPDALFTAGRKAGLMRRMLTAVGPSWQFAPLRRVIQSAFFVLFCVLFFHTWWPYSAAPSPEAVGWPSHYADDFAAGEIGEAELFLLLDPLLGISTAIAAREWIWSLTWAAVILGIGILLPRSFCSYICPLGTLIDLFDRVVGKRLQRFRVTTRGGWSHLKYYILASTLVAAACGVLLSGYVAAIPVITRGFTFIGAPIQLGWVRGWYQVPPMNAGHALSILLFALVLALGVLRPRFWCQYVCPTGALFSVGNLFRASQRQVEDSCINCNKCVEVCPFDAIKPDFTTRTLDCTLCQTCGGVCPTKAIKFVDRWNDQDLKSVGDDVEIPLSRRGFLGAAVVGVGAALDVDVLVGGSQREPLVRPPMSVPEEQFLQMCIRCDACLKVCPNSVLQAAGLASGFDALWTPQVAADWSGCDPSCNNCGQICPTGAIRALPLEEKRVAKMGLAEIKPNCLPLAGEEACELCVVECTQAGYDAIEFERVHAQVDDSGLPREGTGFLAPVIIADKCVGCGLCQSVCHRINVRSEHKLTEAAVVVYAGPGKEDRLLHGSYVELRAQEQATRQAELQQRAKDLEDFY